jgi:hypothetical protein
LDYRVGTVYQPDEHSLELGRGELLELNDALHQMDGKIVQMAMRDFYYMAAVATFFMYFK